MSILLCVAKQMFGSMRLEKFVICDAAVGHIMVLELECLLEQNVISGHVAYFFFYFFQQICAKVKGELVRNLIFATSFSILSGSACEERKRLENFHCLMSASKV